MKELASNVNAIWDKINSHKHTYAKKNIKEDFSVIMDNMCTKFNYDPSNLTTTFKDNSNRTNSEVRIEEEKTEENMTGEDNALGINEKLEQIIQSQRDINTRVNNIESTMRSNAPHRNYQNRTFNRNFRNRTFNRNFRPSNRSNRPPHSFTTQPSFQFPNPYFNTQYVPYYHQYNTNFQNYSNLPYNNPYNHNPNNVNQYNNQNSYQNRYPVYNQNSN